MQYSSKTFFTNVNNQVKFWNRWGRRPHTKKLSSALYKSSPLCNLLQQNGFLHGGVTRANTKYLTVTTGFCRLKQVKSRDLVESLPVFWKQAADRKGSTHDRCLSLAVSFEFSTIFYDKKMKVTHLSAWEFDKSRKQRKWTFRRGLSMNDQQRGHAETLQCFVSWPISRCFPGTVSIVFCRGTTANTLFASTSSVAGMSLRVAQDGSFKQTPHTTYTSLNSFRQEAGEKTSRRPITCKDIENHCQQTAQ